MLRRQTSDLSPKQQTVVRAQSQSSPVSRLTSAPSLSSQCSGTYSADSILSFDETPFFHSQAGRRKSYPLQKSTPYPWAMTAVALMLAILFCGGALFMNQNQYGHIHDHIDQEYNLYVAVWQAGELEDFYNTNWMLVVDDVHTFDLTRTAEFTKTAKTVLGTKVRRNMSTHVEFSADKLLDSVFFAEDQSRSQNGVSNRLRSVKPEMFAHQNFRLRGVHEASGYTSWVTLEDYPFVRQRPAMMGLTARQCELQQGRMEENACLVMEYLSEVCIRVMVDPESHSRHNYDIDYTHADAGCYPEDGLRIPQYSTLPYVSGQNGYLLPTAAQNATRMTLRHAHDPELMEKVLKHELLEELRTKKQRFFMGAAVALLSLLLLVPVWAHVTKALTLRKLNFWYKRVPVKYEDAVELRLQTTLSV